MKCRITCGISSGFALFAQTKLIVRERNTIFFEVLTCDPSIYTMDHPDLPVSNFMENFIGLKRVEVKLQKSVSHIYDNS